MNLSIGKYNDMTFKSAGFPFPSEKNADKTAPAPLSPKKEKDTEKESREKRAGLKDPNEECETCKRRKYQDGSDEMVSFKSAAHISPESAAARVRAHEQEHVSNAYKKASANNGRVISASVSIQTAICPECGRTYVSGGTTHTQIKYYNEDNPYQKGLKSADRAKYSGRNIDYAV
ncbi:MAG: hypothetical protein NC541_04165 [bacterium]|nr:hypothetical protein [bacterium]